MTAREYYARRSIEDPYFSDRLANPYRSTVAFEAFLLQYGFFSNILKDKLIFDVACGTGSETAYFATHHSHLNFVGVDLEDRFIDAANARFSIVSNATFRQGDLYELNKLPEWVAAQAVWISQTLSFLPWWEEELHSLIGPNIDRIAFSILAWDGEAQSEVIHHFGQRGKDESLAVNYNVLSLPRIKERMAQLGFNHFEIVPF